MPPASMRAWAIRGAFGACSLHQDRALYWLGEFFRVLQTSIGGGQACHNILQYHADQAEEAVDALKRFSRWQKNEMDW